MSSGECADRRDPDAAPVALVEGRALRCRFGGQSRRIGCQLATSQVDPLRHQFWLVRGGGDTTISLRHRTQRALVPTISQAGSPDTMSRRHFGQVYPLSCRGEVILWTDIGTHHVMKHRKDLQPLGAASRAHRLIPFNLHCVALRATSAASCSIRPEEMHQPSGDVGRNTRCSACGRRPWCSGAAATRPD